MEIIKHFSTTALDNYGGVLSSVSPRCKETGDIKQTKTGYSIFVWWADISVISVVSLAEQTHISGNKRSLIPTWAVVIFEPEKSGNWEELELGRGGITFRPLCLVYKNPRVRTVMLMHPQRTPTPAEYSLYRRLTAVEFIYSRTC